MKILQCKYGHIGQVTFDFFGWSLTVGCLTDRSNSTEMKEIELTSLDYAVFLIDIRWPENQTILKVIFYCLLVGNAMKKLFKAP